MRTFSVSTVSKLLVVLALLVFVLAAFHVGFGLDMTALGLALYMASRLFLPE